ncbi:MAG: hypothetical protein K9J30_10395 [Bacteroidales bacterium]|nr:hypothetical protein [Bacteroidales bacterium]
MKNKTSKEKNEPGFWDDTKENINEGARVIGEEARDIGERISSYSEIIFGKIKEKTEEVFQSGKDLTEDAVNRAQEVAEKYRDRSEIRKLNEEKKKVASQLGMSFYLILKNNDNKVPETILRRKAIKTTLHEMEELDRKILDLSDENN